VLCSSTTRKAYPFSSQPYKSIQYFADHRSGVFYIFTIITNGTHQIIIFRMAPTTIPVERGLTYNFTTFAYVASHAAMQRWRPVSPKCEMSSLPPISSLSPSPTAGSQLYSHIQVGPTCQLHLLPIDTATATGPSTTTAPSTAPATRW